MAYMGRGGFSPRGSSGGNGNTSGGSRNSGLQSSGERMRGYFRSHRVHYYIPLDNSYFVIQMVLTFLIIIIGAITYIVTYKSSIIDPIEGIKNTFLNSYLITIAVLLIITFVLHYVCEDEDVLIPWLTIVFIISLIVMAGFFKYKLDMDKTYTSAAEFGRIYMQENSGNGKTMLTIGLSGASLKTQKEYYISECVALYRNFTIKVYSVLVMHALLNILLIYQITRVIKRDSKIDRLEKDDLIVYDDEQNIKM